MGSPVPMSRDRAERSDMAVMTLRGINEYKRGVKSSCDHRLEVYQASTMYYVPCDAPELCSFQVERSMNVLKGLGR